MHRFSLWHGVVFILGELKFIRLVSGTYYATMWRHQVRLDGALRDIPQGQLIRECCFQ